MLYRPRLQEPPKLTEAVDDMTRIAELAPTGANRANLDALVLSLLP